MPHMVLHNCIDMEAGPDGKIYLLEYGTAWFQKNPDAGLSRIDYHENPTAEVAVRRRRLIHPLPHTVLMLPVMH